MSLDSYLVFAPSLVVFCALLVVWRVSARISNSFRALALWAAWLVFALLVAYFGGWCLPGTHRDEIPPEAERR